MKTGSTLLFVAMLLCLASATAADEIGAQEKEKIEYLINQLESMKDATFIRNDKEYDARTAALFLRRKWQMNKDKVRTSEDFIERIASRSSTTGKPYRIRMKDGREIECGDYLREMLISQGPDLDR
jgi:predicted RND superfamily exporter protein